jgi:hypothetical protein
MNTFLTKDEIKELTGYTYKRQQCQALTRLGVNFMVNPRFGHPMVMWKEYEMQACGNSPSGESSINLAALKALS